MRVFYDNESINYTIPFSSSSLYIQLIGNAGIPILLQKSSFSEQLSTVNLDKSCNFSAT